jgi:hypothetical protein
MGQTVTLSTAEGPTIVLSRFEEKLRDFCLHDAYRGYDFTAAVDDMVTLRQINAVNDAMMARTPGDAWKPLIAPNTIPQLARVPKELDLIDWNNQYYALGRESVGRLCEGCGNCFWSG